jgi:hypothetical protein
MSRFQAIVIFLTLIVWIPLLCSDAYISYLAKEYFSGGSYGSDLELGFMIAMCIIIFLKFVNAIFVIREICYNDGVVRISYATIGVSLLVIAISIISAIVFDGRYLIFNGIPHDVARFTVMVSTASISVIIAIFVFGTILIAIQNIDSESVKESISRNFKGLFKRDVAKIYAADPENMA